MTNDLSLTLPAGIWLIGLLPVLMLVERLFTLAFLRRAEVFVGPLHDKSHRFARVDGGLLRTREATPVTFDNGLFGSIRRQGDGLTAVSVDFEYDANTKTIGFICKPDDGHHFLYAGASMDPPATSEKVAVVPSGGARGLRDLWMGARTDLTESHGIWVRESGLLFRSQRAGDLVALAPRGAAAYILYNRGSESPEEKAPLVTGRNFWDLLIPGSFIFVCLYPWLTAMDPRPASLYAFYAGILVLLWGLAVWVDSMQKDRVSKWLHLANRNTGLARWNGFILTLVTAVCVISLVSGKFATLPLALVVGVSVATNWARFTSAPWTVRAPVTDHKPAEK